MKDLLIILVLLFIISACSQTTNKPEKTTAEKYGLKGNVKSIRISNFKAKENFGIDVIKDGRTKKSWRTVDYGEDSCYKFNEFGRFIEREWLPYDERGQYINDYSKIEESNSLMSKEESIYDVNKLIRKIETYPNNRVMNTSYVYGVNGKLDSIKYCNRLKDDSDGCSNGNVFVKYKYDVNGFIASETFLFNDEIRLNNIYTCNSKGNILKDKEYGYNENTNVHGELISTTNYEYDELNRVVLKKIIKIAQGPRNEEYKYKYYEDTKIAVMEYTTFSESSQHTIYYNYLYEFNGDLISTHISSNQGLTVETFKYTYDNKNNWIKKVGYTNDKPVTITERTIDYF